MTRVVNIHEAKTHLSRLLEEVRQGGEVVIAKRGVRVARLVPDTPVAAPVRRIGWAKGLFPELESLFEDPAALEMTEEEIDEWYKPLDDEDALVNFLTNLPE